ncbi:UNVERIFIED_CONTAM: hypothetical protein PYX00_002347 [Menopon gallinae]|uniref:Inter-alpha-trypsin inhibitor heavy chain H4-like n=1 Tax=Menopon gallinae TaxID=328185 RepID=A0AAW2IGX8_9NEOP
MGWTWTVLLLSILAYSAHSRVLEGSSLSVIVKRQADDVPKEPPVTAEEIPLDGSLVDIFSTSTKEKKPLKTVIQSLHVVSNVTFRYAKTLIESKILNPADVAQEVFFNVIIPESAFISGFAMEIDGKVYEAYVKEKQEAQKVYDTAVKQGITAGQVKQSARDSNRFSVSVNVEPNKKVRFNLTYEELLERKFGHYRHVVNINPGQLVDDLSVKISVHENRNITKFRIPQFQSGNEIYPVLDEIDSELGVTERLSPTEVAVTFKPTVEDQKKLRKNLKGGDSLGPEEILEGMSGQFAIEYDVERDANGGEILVNDGYFVHFFAPSELPSLKKHIIFVLDVSGSMDGRKIEQLKQAMDGILGELKPHDFFNIIEFAFSVTVRDLDSPELTAVDNPWLVNLKSNVTKKVKPFPATPEYIQKGKDVIKKMAAAGGTNIYDALNVAIEVAKSGMEQGIVKRSADEDKQFKAPEPMIIFLSDGEPTVGETSDSKILKNIDEKNNEPRIPIFSLAFGADADFTLLKRVSLLTNGFARQIYEAADTSLQLRNFYKQISSPELSKVKFVYPPEQVQDETITKVNFANFFGGSELVVSGKLKDENVTPDMGFVEANSAEGIRNYSMIHIDCAPPILKAERNYRPLERLWVYMTIKDLLNQAELIKARSYLLNYKEESKPLELGPEDKALRLALEYSFVTPLTSLVVVKPGSLTDTNVEPAVASPAPALFMKSQAFASVLPLRFGAAPSAQGPHLSTPRISFAPPNLLFKSPGLPPPPALTTEAVNRDFNTTESEQQEFLNLESITWLDSVRTGDVLRFPGDATSTDYLLATNQADEPHGNCTVTSTGSTGLCRHLNYCVLSDIVDSVDTYYQNYFCMIPGNFAGICCPV